MLTVEELLTVTVCLCYYSDNRLWSSERQPNGHRLTRDKESVQSSSDSIYWAVAESSEIAAWSGIKYIICFQI